jgi:hypothetical protein
VGATAEQANRKQIARAATAVVFGVLAATAGRLAAGVAVNTRLSTAVLTGFHGYVGRRAASSYPR